MKGNFVDPLLFSYDIEIIDRDKLKCNNFEIAKFLLLLSFELLFFFGSHHCQFVDKKIALLKEFTVILFLGTFFAVQCLELVFWVYNFFFNLKNATVKIMFLKFQIINPFIRAEFFIKIDSESYNCILFHKFIRFSHEKAGHVFFVQKTCYFSFEKCFIIKKLSVFSLF